MGSKLGLFSLLSLISRKCINSSCTDATTSSVEGNGSFSFKREVRKSFSKAGISPLLPHQLEELSRQKLGVGANSGDNKRRKLLVIGQDGMEPLQALGSSGHEVAVCTIRSRT